MILNSTARSALWTRLVDGEPWDLIIIGGGITGAGLLREASRRKLKALLVEQRDFAWGSSSRSSKLVHGGLRYLKQGHIKLTLDTVLERERLLKDAPGLVTPLGFLLPTPKSARFSRLLYGTGLALYDWMAGKRTHSHFNAAAFEAKAPHLGMAPVTGGFEFFDAQTDDARLTVRLVLESLVDGGAALNYARADSLLREGSEVVGVRLADGVSGLQVEVRARAVVNATGAWADRLRKEVNAPPRIRPLRGSHLVFSARRFPLGEAFSVEHPRDHRPVYAFPWEGVTVLGTTDLDHHAPLDAEPRISVDEVKYLMEVCDAWFPKLQLGLEDVMGTFAGIRPVVGSGAAKPSDESREAAVWQENGLLTLTGGKLTTFRLTAIEALEKLRSRLPAGAKVEGDAPLLEGSPELSSGLLSPEQAARIGGRYGLHAGDLVAAAHPGELEAWPETPVCPAELRWSARAEGIVHLEDLMLRRSRIGVTYMNGAMGLLPQIRRICQPELRWSDATWEREEAAYRLLWNSAYGLPAELKEGQETLAEVISATA